MQKDVPGRKSKIAIYGLTITGTVAIGVSVIAASFISPALKRICLPFVPATEKQIKNVLKLCHRCENKRKLVDLGSGDGRVVHAAARRGYAAVGYEINPWLVLYSKLYSRLKGISNTSFRRRDLWKENYSDFDNIIIFGVAEMMDELSYKLEKEMDDDARVIVCRFPIQRWSPAREIEEGVDSAWMYTKNSFHVK